MATKKPATKAHENDGREINGPEKKLLFPPEKEKECKVSQLSIFQRLLLLIVNFLGCSSES